VALFDDGEIVVSVPDLSNNPFNRIQKKRYTETTITSAMS
jgi:hypothetical protein